LNPVSPRGDNVERIRRLLRLVAAVEKGHPDARESRPSARSIEKRQRINKGGCHGKWINPRGSRDAWRKYSDVRKSSAIGPKANRHAHFRDAAGFSAPLRRARVSADERQII
jgi:hypothetical protein